MEISVINKAVLLLIVAIFSGCDLFPNIVDVHGEIYFNSIFREMNTHKKILADSSSGSLKGLELFASDGHTLKHGEGTVVKITIQREGGPHKSSSNVLSIYIKPRLAIEGEYRFDSDDILGFYSQGPVPSEHYRRYGHVDAGFLTIEKHNKSLSIKYEISGMYYDLITVQGGRYGDFGEKGKVLIPLKASEDKGIPIP